MTQLVATAVAVDGRGVMLLGPSGSGKSEMAFALINRGAMLIGDDAAELSALQGGIHIGPPVRNKGMLALRDIGVVTLPCVDGPVPLALAVTLDPHRAPQPLPRVGRFGPVDGLYAPMVTMHPGTTAIVDKLLLALERWGL